MKNIFSFTILITSFCMLLGSCSNKGFLVAPEFTNIDKIIKLETGMTLEEVNTELRIRPFDAYNLDDNNLTLVYNYRLKERRIPVTNYGVYVNLYDDAVNKSVHSEDAQKNGTVFYTKWKRLFVHFKDGKCAGYITDSGREDANHLALINGSIRLLREDSKLKIIGEHVVPLDENGNFWSYPKGEENSENSYFWLNLGNGVNKIFGIDKDKKKKGYK